MKRLFFAFKVASPWPQENPHGRVIAEDSRHVTLAFLGDVEEEKAKGILHEFPLPPFRVGPVGYFDRCQFLPERHPHVASWHALGLEKLDNYHLEVADWLRSHQFLIERRPFLPHVSIAREPFEKTAWEQAFKPLPLKIEGLHLYESLGHLTYIPIWSYPLLPPFVEIEHTADVAFHIQAERKEDIHLHAKMALAFKYPLLLDYVKEGPLEQDLNSIIISLNEVITRADSEVGCPLKAVSFHGDLEEEKGIYSWEMIVDV